MLALCPAAHAADASGLGISNQMTNLFDTLLHYTAPTAHLGQRRGVLTGGAVNARNRIMNESLWHFVPPSFNATLAAGGPPTGMSWPSSRSARRSTRSSCVSLSAVRSRAGPRTPRSGSAQGPG